MSKLSSEHRREGWAAERRAREAAATDAKQFADGREQSATSQYLQEGRDRYEKGNRHAMATSQIEGYKVKAAGAAALEAESKALLANGRLNSENTAALRKERATLAKKQSHEAAVMQLEGFKQSRLAQQVNEASVREALANAKIQSELGAHARAERERLAKEQRHLRAEGDVEGFKQNRLQQRLEDQSKREALANAKIQSELGAHARAERERLAKEQRHLRAEVVTEGYRATQKARFLELKSESEALENAKIQHAMAAHVR